MGPEISIRESGDVTILDLRGRSTLNGGETELLSSNLRKLLAGGVFKLFLNLTELAQVDSSGVSVIVETYVSVKPRGGDLRLLRPSGHALEVLSVLRLLDIIPRFGDKTQALASFRPRGYSATR